jgi:hypothetical protein
MGSAPTLNADLSSGVAASERTALSITELLQHRYEVDMF